MTTIPRGGKPVVPITGTVLPLSEAKAVPDRRQSLGEYSSAASASTKHPFKEKGPWRQGCESVLASSLLPSLVIVLLFFGGVAALTVFGVLDDPAIHGSAVIVGYLGFEVLTVRVARMSYVQRFLRPLSSTVVSCLLMHAIFTWYAVWQFCLWSSRKNNRVAEDIVRIVLLYMALAAVAVLGRWSSGAKEWQELQYQVRELTTQCDALSRALHEREVDDDDDSISTQGDEREYLIIPPERIHIPPELLGKPVQTLQIMLQDHKFDHALAMKIATRLRNPKYSLAHYYEDLQAAFPELRLYMATTEYVEAGRESDVEGGEVGGAVHKTGVSSGLDAADEYRRSIGALFAVYWLMRIGIDGERGFTLGVDEQWEAHHLWEEPRKSIVGAGAAAEPLPPLAPRGSLSSTSPVPPIAQRGSLSSNPAFWAHESSPKIGLASLPEGASFSSHPSSFKSTNKEEAPYTEQAKRRAFYKTQDWARLQQLLIDAGMLVRGPGSSALSSLEEQLANVQVVPERAMAMLALTAFHDVMKVEALLPRVAPEHAPFLGFKADDIINDHDIALGYVLSHHAQMLPSFAALPPADQHTIRFTQSKMSFNHGWLVQGEAPPAPLFAKFKEVLQTESVEKADVAFYFVHWLTDLAGAEPSPLGGAEKLVLKFPHAVLDSFIQSFGVLNHLAVRSETEVMEEHLAAAWAQRCTVDGRAVVPPEPRGDPAIAKMRLSLQAQTPEKQEAVLACFDKLDQSEQRLLSEEMARTGIAGQRFYRGPEFGETVVGPAFLVYYSPAFVRNLSPLDALPALRILAEVYRRARQLWPLRPSADAHHSVTIRIDQIKELKLSAIMAAFAEGESWLLVRQNDREGVVERHRLDDMAKVMQDGNAVVLKVWRADRAEGRESGYNDGRHRGKLGRNRSKKVGFLNPAKSCKSEASSFKSKSDGASSSASMRSGGINSSSLSGRSSQSGGISSSQMSGQTESGSANSSLPPAALGTAPSTDTPGPLPM